MNTYIIGTEEKLDYPQDWKSKDVNRAIWSLSIASGLLMLLTVALFAVYVLFKSIPALAVGSCGLLFASGFISFVIFLHKEKKRNLHLFASTVMWLIKQRHGINISRNDAYKMLLPVGSSITKQATVNVNGEQVTVELGSQEDGKDIRFYHARSNRELKVR